jgi:hypothetical protein
MTSFSLDVLGVAAMSDLFLFWFLHIHSLKCIRFSLRKNFRQRKTYKNDLKCMRFSRNVNLHRLRNKFNFPEHEDEEKFSLFLAYSL